MKRIIPFLLLVLAACAPQTSPAPPSTTPSHGAIPIGVLRASSFTVNLCVEQPTPGDPAQTNIWGTTLDTGLSLFDSAIAGILSLNVGGNANVVLTQNCGAADQERNQHFNFTGALTGNITVFFPASRNKVFSVANNTTGPFTLKICVNSSGSCAGASQVVTQGAGNEYVSDGTNITPRITAAGVGGVTSVSPGSSGCLTTTPNPIIATGTVDVTGSVTSIGCGGTGSTTASAARTALGLKAAATEALGGAVVDDGAGNLTVGAAKVTSAMLGSSIVTNGALANMNANTTKCNNTGSSAGPIDCTVAQMNTMLGTAPFSLASFSSHGTFTYTPATGETRDWVRCVGPGGGGAGSATTASGSGGGGGAGAYAEGIVSVTPGTPVTVTIGTGGAGATAGANNGSAGSGSTSFGASIVAAAGAGGVSGGGGGSGGAGGSSTGTYVTSGGAGSGGAAGNSAFPYGGAGGNSLLGAGGPAESISNGVAASGSGGGGGGGGGNNSAGGAGADGACLIMAL